MPSPNLRLYLMRIWLDSEFNGFGGDLLSIALVAENGNYLYEVLPHDHLNIDSWVEINVLDKILLSPLTQEYDQDINSISLVQQKLSRFLCQFESECVTIIADWPDDIRYLMQLMIVGPGEMITTPHIMNYVVDRTVFYTSQHPHHAYYDALAIMDYTLSNELGV